MACSDYQTECLRVVTIGYLKRFIGQSGSSSLIKDSSNENVSKLISRTDDTYCPTYGELIGGGIIQNWKQGDTPNGDRDGIVVNSTWAGGSSAYATNQLVDQKDLSMKYTRWKTFTVSSPSGDIGQCGGNKSVSYVHQYTRYNKTMDSSCSVSTTSATVSDTTNSEVTWTGCNWITVNRDTLVATAVRQPETRTADRRCCSVKGQITFRGTAHSDTTSICQEALGGYWVLSGRAYTDITITASTTSPFGCDGGSFSLTGTGYFYDRYFWKDNCNTEYRTSPFDDRHGTESAGSTSSTFTEVSCCDGDYSTDKTLSLTYHGHSKSYTFSQSCPGCEDDPDCKPCEGHEVTIEYDKEPSCTGGTVTFCIDGSCTGPGPQPVDCPASGGSVGTGVFAVFEHQLDADSGTDTGITAVLTADTAFASAKSITVDGTVVTAANWTGSGEGLPSGWERISVTRSANPGTSTRSGSMTVTMTKTDGGDCSYTANFTQKAPSTPACTVTFNISGSYNYIDTVSLQGSSGGGTYRLNGSGSSRTAEIACGITFTGIVFNDTVQQHCAYLTSSTGGTISNGATFSATITGNTCGN